MLGREKQEREQRLYVAGPETEAGLLLVHSQASAVRIKLGMGPFLPATFTVIIQSQQSHSELACNREPPPPRVTPTHPFHNLFSAVLGLKKNMASPVSIPHSFFITSFFLYFLISHNLLVFHCYLYKIMLNSTKNYF